MDDEIRALGAFTGRVIEFGVQYGFQMLGALIILALGYFVARRVGALVERLCARREFDVTLTRFFASVARITVLAFVLIAALGKFGITIAPLIAALGAVAFGSSLALAGPLSNYGAGLAIILARPFKIGDTIAVQGAYGVVHDIRLGATSLRTEDGETVIIPNKEIVGQVLVNSYANRVVELRVGIAYGDDPARAVEVITRALATVAEVVQQPPPQVGIGAFADSALTIEIRYWVPTARYFQVRFAANAVVWQALCAAGLRVPGPRQEVTLVDVRASGADV